MVLILFNILSRIRADRRDAAETRRCGCKEQIRQKHRLPLALDLVPALLQVDRQQFFPDMVIRRYKNIQAWTYSDAILGARWVYFTCEPENIQAILSTQSHNFLASTIEDEECSAASGSRHLHGRLIRPGNILEL